MTETIKAMLEDPESDNREINARIYAFLKLHDNFKVSIHKGGGSVTYRHNSWPEDAQSVLYHLFDHHNYTTSLDVAMSIGAEELEGYHIYINQYSKGFRCCLTKANDDWFMASDIPDMPRAVCYARIQGLQWKRENLPSGKLIPLLAKNNEKLPEREWKKGR